MFRFLFYFAAIVYRAAYLLHHKFCLRPGKPLRHSRLVVVGSYRTGGAGKTPFCICLTEHLVAQGKRVAVLCHRYAYDEVELIKSKFAGVPQVQVFATNNRYRMAHELDETRKFDVILCDDGFEDSRLVGAVTFVLLWEKPPVKMSDLWPVGYAKSMVRDHRNAARVIEVRCYGDEPDIRFALDKVTTLDGKECSLQSDCRQMHVFCGVGDPKRFCSDLEALGIEISGRTFLMDHDREFARKLDSAMRLYPDDVFVMTEKDAARLPVDKILQENPESLWRIAVAHQKITVKEGLYSLD